ncbi:MAG: amidohydrolase family protein [Salinibacter sp.]
MTASPLRRLGLLVLAVLLAAAPPAQAQDDDFTVPDVTDTYALENAQVVQAPGDVLESATVVVRDGIIEAVGPDVEVPYDAYRIAADSLVVYAGFIDGLSHAGVEMPEDEEDNGEEIDPGDPPHDAAGIQPDRSVRSFLSPDASDLEALRESGFTAGHVVPEGEMLPGSGAIALYGGDTGNDMVLNTDQTLFAQLQTADGYVYPATTMAVIAQMRQLYREADRRQELEAAYDRNPTGQSRPPQDPAHSALFPVLDGDQPLAYYADDALSIHRVLDLQQELGFPLVLAGLAESHATIDALQSTDAPLFLTLDLPEEPTRTAEDDTTIADTTEAPVRDYNPEFTVPSYETVAEEEANLELRHAVERQDYLQTAATLHDAGLQFGFTTREVDAGDIRENVHTMIEEGLPESVALASLTTRPASILGLSAQLGTVEEGKIANLVVTDGSYFAEDTDVQHVFVDGQLYDYSSDASEEGEVTGEVSKVVGTWSYTLETPQGDRTGTLTFEGDDSGLEGTIVNSQGDETDLESISFDGTTLSFTVPSSEGPSLSMTVTVEDDTFEGSVSTPGPTLSITGERTSTPDASQE